MAEGQREIKQEKKGQGRDTDIQVWHIDRLKDGYLCDWWSVSVFLKYWHFWKIVMSEVRFSLVYTGPHTIPPENKNKIHPLAVWNSNNCPCSVDEWYEICHSAWTIIINPMQLLCKWPGILQITAFCTGSTVWQWSNTLLIPGLFNNSL